MSSDAGFSERLIAHFHSSGFRRVRHVPRRPVEELFTRSSLTDASSSTLFCSHSRFGILWLSFVRAARRGAALRRACNPIFLCANRGSTVGLVANIPDHRLPQARFFVPREQEKMFRNRRSLALSCLSSRRTRGTLINKSKRVFLDKSSAAPRRFGAACRVFFDKSLALCVFFSTDLSLSLLLVSRSPSSEIIGEAKWNP